MKRYIAILVAAFMALAASAQDVVRLGFYHDANIALGAPSKGEKRIVLIGDSITEGWGTHAGEFFTDGRICRGISGEVTAQMLLRFRQDVIDLKPKKVVILAGTNDIALNLGAYNEDYTFGNIVSMVELAKAHKIKVVLCSVTPASSFRWRPEVKDGPEKITALNARLQAYAKANHITYVNYYDALLDEDGRSLRADLSPDGVHPNHAGYEIMASILLKALK